MFNKADVLSIYQWQPTKTLGSQEAATICEGSRTCIKVQ